MSRNTRATNGRARALPREREEQNMYHIFVQFVYIGAHERCRTSSSACLNCFSYFFFVRWIRAPRHAFRICEIVNENATHSACLTIVIIIIIHLENGRWKGKKREKSFSSSIFSLLYRFSSKIIFRFKSKAVGDACDVRMRFSVYVSSPPLRSRRTQFDCCPMPVHTYLRTTAVSRGNRVRIFPPTFFWKSLRTTHR